MTNMVRDFLLSMIFSLIVYTAGEFFFFVHFKMIIIMLGMTFCFGILSSNIDEAAGNLMGLVVGQAIGCMLYITLNRPDLPPTLFAEILRGMVDKCEFVLWTVGFPAGYVLRRFMPRSFSETSDAVAIKDEHYAQDARNDFIENKLGVRTRPVSMRLRDQGGDLATTPSIQILP